MSLYPTPPSINLPQKKNTESFALVATLALVAVATILLVLFVTTSSLDRTASYSYSQSVKADQIGLGGLHLVVGQLQAEMAKDAMPDTNNSPTYVPLFTNVTSANILPQATVTNSALPIMVKMSTNNNLPFYSGVLSTSSLQSSTTAVSSTTPSINGRSVSTNIWNQTYFGKYQSSQSAPYWLLMTRNGAANAAAISFGTTGNTVNNSAPANPNYVLGRIAYAVYDEGQLLDVTAAGYPDSTSSVPLSAAQLAQIKGTLAGADLTKVGITSPSTFIQWRNAQTGQSASSYVAYVTNFASTNGFGQVYPGDSTFLSRQDLIRAAQNTTAGLTMSSLTNLTTFTREANAPTWTPTLNGSGTSTAYNYAANALSSTRTAPPAPALSTATPSTANPNRFVPHVRYPASTPAATSVTGYNSDGTTYPITAITVNPGDPLVQRRFPLDHLNWIGLGGPNTAAFNSSLTAAKQAAAIQACFGLKWGAVSTANPDTNWTTLTGNVVWQYVGPTGSTEQQYIETLDQVAAEATPRQPNFFELLQAGILNGSLGDYAGVDTIHPKDTQLYSTLQLLRIGASIIAQVQSSAYPINIEYSQAQYVQGVASGKQVALVANGVANLPYLNLFQPVSGLNPVDPGWANPMVPGTSTTSGQHYLATYLLFGLWNPHQQPATQPTRPKVRLYIQGQMSVGVRWGYGTTPKATPFTTYVPNTVASLSYGPSVTLAANTTSTDGTFIDLANTAGSGTGVNGFFNPGLLTASDVVSPTGGTPAPYANSHAGGSWFHTTQKTGDPISPTDSSLLLDPNISYAVFDIRSSTGVPYRINIGGNNSDTTPNTGNSTVDCTLGTSSPNRTIFNFGVGSAFQVILKYQDPNNVNNWIPYDYWNGVNDPADWISGEAIYTGNMFSSKSASGNVAQPDPASTFYIPTLNMDFYEAVSPTYGTAWAHCGTDLTCDPRSVRFGLWNINRDGVGGAGTLGNGSYMAVDSLWSGASGASANPPAAFPAATLRNSGVRTPAFAQYGYGLGGADPGASPMPNPAAGASTMPYPSPFASQWLPALLCRNVAGANASSYPDVDGITRVADSGLFPPPAGLSTAPTQGNPFSYLTGYTPSNFTGQRTADRPIILNRPFNSVGELGYTFRDDPWRSLDFFSVSTASSPSVSTSADSGLLDLFTVTDSPNTVLAGRVNLNTHNQNVLSAIFSKTVANAGDTVNNTAVSNLASPSGFAYALATFTATTPLLNKDQLVTQFGPALTSAPFNGGDDQNVKAYREAYVRSLADVGQTRTWNLLIDLVAQSGKYPPGATALDKFEVDGERHYWLHVAIDRFTGKVVDRQLELVGP